MEGRPPGRSACSSAASSLHDGWMQDTTQIPGGRWPKKTERQRSSARGLLHVHISVDFIVYATPSRVDYEINAEMDMPHPPPTLGHQAREHAIRSHIKNAFRVSQHPVLTDASLKKGKNDTEAGFFCAFTDVIVMCTV